MPIEKDRLVYAAPKATNGFITSLVKSDIVSNVVILESSKFAKARDFKVAENDVYIAGLRVGGGLQYREGHNIWQKPKTVEETIIVPLDARTIAGWSTAIKNTSEKLGLAITQEASDFAAAALIGSHEWAHILSHGLVSVLVEETKSKGANTKRHGRSCTR